MNKKDASKPSEPVVDEEADAGAYFENRVATGLLVLFSFL
jgi:hypothetical protein